MKRNFLLAVIVILILTVFLITACNGVIAAIFDGASGEWTISAAIDLGDGAWTGTSPGETNVEISEDLENITGVATMVIPPVSQRTIKGFTKIILNSGTSMLIKEIFPNLKRELMPRDGNVATITEADGNAYVEFETHFNGLDVATSTANFYVDGTFIDQYEAIITRNRSEENPNQVIFNIEIPSMPAEYVITCTR